MKIDFLFMILGLCFGIFIIYVTSAPPKVVLKYPTIDNIEDTTYVDENGQCYKYFAIEVPCKPELANQSTNQSKRKLSESDGDHSKVNPKLIRLD